MVSSLTTIVTKVLKKEFGVSDVQVAWERPQDAAHGDTATPIALQLSKKLGRPPREIAEKLVAALKKTSDVERAEVAGPGYVNVWLKAEALIAALGDIRKSCTAQVKKKTSAPVIVEYSQPNIAKPLGAHHLLSTLIGQAIANLYDHLGYNVIRWNYIGDWGTQFGKLAVAVERWGDGRPASQYSIDELLELYVRFHTEAETNPALEDEGRATFKKLEEGDKALRAFWSDVVATTKSSLTGMYTTLHVKFDTDLGESFYEDKMDDVLAEGQKKGVFAEGEGGSLIVEFPEETGMPPYLVRKGDGATLYSTRDIAQMRYRIDTHHPEEILIVTDIAQKLHFEQLEETCRMLEWELPEFENVLVGRMRFADKSMSTRKGNVLKLEDVLAEAVRRAEETIASHGDSIQSDDAADLASMMGVGAISYGILSQNRKQDIVFDWDSMLSFDGNSAPYLQYTHARAKSVVEKFGKKPAAPKEDITELSHTERTLLNTLLRFRAVLEEARGSHMPHILANFLFELAQDFNAFYSAEPILKAAEPQRGLRVYLTDLTATVLQAGAALLTIRVPDRM